MAEDWQVSLDAIRLSYRPGVRGTGGTALFDVELIEVDRGLTVFRLPITDAVRGGVGGGVHGGVIAALVDIGLVSAVLSACRQSDEMRGTAELNVSYLRPAQGKALITRTTILKKGRTLAVGDVDVENDAGVLVAKGRGTYALGQRG